MPFIKGQAKKPGSGRQKGTCNKITQDLNAKCEELGVDPFEVLALYAKGDWQALGHESRCKVVGVMQSGEPIEEPHISDDLRAKCAKDACEYIYPKRKALEVSGELANPYANKTEAELEAIIREKLK